MRQVSINLKVYFWLPECQFWPVPLFALRTVDDYLEAHEDFLGMVELDAANSAAIVRTLKDCLVRFNLPHLIAVASVTMALVLCLAINLV